MSGKTKYSMEEKVRAAERYLRGEARAAEWEMKVSLFCGLAAECAEMP